MASETLVIGGNRSGKSLCTFVEDAWAATGSHPIAGKYPLTNGSLAIIGANWKHCGLVIYPMLFRAGAFKIIKDDITGHFRAYNPMQDSHRAKEAKPAPPLIPPRMIKSMSWILKASGYLNHCELINGWQINVFSSEGDPPQGFALDRCHVDEDLGNEVWIPEMQARLADRGGRFSWSAMPWSKNDALLGLNERAEAAEGLGIENPNIKRFVLRFLDNPHILPDEKKKMMERWAAAGEDVIRQRAEGEFTIDSILVYPSYNTHVHSITMPDGIPKDWTRYAIVDPGHAVLAVLFAAIDPSEQHIVLYDELYLRNANAEIFGEHFYAKYKEAPHGFHAFYIDSHGARLTDIGSGRSPQQHYTEQLEARNIRSNTTGSSFIPGCDDVQSGLNAVRSDLHIRTTGTPKLRLLAGKVPNLDRELRRYKKKTTNVGGVNIVTDEPNKRGEFHLVDCLRYLCMARPEYHPVKVVSNEPWYIAWSQKRAKAAGNTASISLAPASYTMTWDA